MAKSQKRSGREPKKPKKSKLKGFLPSYGSPHPAVEPDHPGKRSKQVRSCELADASQG